MTEVIHQTVDIGDRWPTIDPFLFCVHHYDEYPNGTAELGPDAPLTGRNMGMDFEGIDGWRMYHGQVAPGFPQHPHRGFETVTYARQGFIDHSDSLGAAARFGRGDVQWLTAGSGIVHSEMFPLVNADAPNPTELFQIWLNLPPEDKFAAPYFSMLWSEDIPVLEHVDDDGNSARITVIAGDLDRSTPPEPPPASWASRADSDVAIWHVVLQPGAAWTLPAAGDATVRTIYVFEGDELGIGDTIVRGSTASVLAPVEVELTATGVDTVECLVLQGRPIGAQVAQYGPFVMNTEEEVQQAFRDYQQTQFGGWPWPSDEPVNAADRGRFAQRPDTGLEVPAP